MINNLISDLVAVVGVGMIIFQLYLFMAVIRLKREKKWTDKKEKRLQRIMANMRATAAILLAVASITVVVRIIQNM